MKRREFSAENYESSVSRRGGVAQDYLISCEQATLARFERLRKDLYEAPQKYTIKQLADGMNYSPTWFGILYKRIFGISPVKDKERALVQKIKEDLLSEEKTLEKIAEQWGMSSASYLIRVFKRVEGISPSQFRALNAKKS